jgi:hypothetical protein
MRTIGPRARRRLASRSRSRATPRPLAERLRRIIAEGDPRLARLLEVRLEFFADRLGRARQLLDGTQAEARELEELIRSILRGGDEGGRPDDRPFTISGQFPDKLEDRTRPRARPGGGTQGPGRTGGPQPRNQRERILFQVFEQLEGDESAFTSEGRPQVAAVDAQLAAMGEESSTRDEIDRAYRHFQAR